jgi:hypothetical protein
MRQFNMGKGENEGKQEDCKCSKGSCINRHLPVSQEIGAKAKA